MMKTDKELLLNGKIGYVEINQETGMIEWIRVDKGEDSCVVYSTKDELKVTQTRGT